MENRPSTPRTPEEIKAYLANIKRTVSESEALIESVRHRMGQTDEMLAQYGLTREQVLDWRPSKEQRLAVNEALQAQGLPPIEEDGTYSDFDAATARVRTSIKASAEQRDVIDENADQDQLEERQKKFNNFMRDYRL